MELFILLHSDAYETATGTIIACSLFRENLTDRMNDMAITENQKIMQYAWQHEAPRSRLYVYNEVEDNWAKWNGKHWTEKLSIERFDMV